MTDFLNMDYEELERRMSALYPIKKTNEPMKYRVRRLTDDRYFSFCAEADGPKFYFGSIPDYYTTDDSQEKILELARQFDRHSPLLVEKVYTISWYTGSPTGRYRTPEPIFNFGK